MNYLKINGQKYELTDDGVKNYGNQLFLTIINNRMSFETVRNLFSNIDNITIFGSVTDYDSDGTENEREYVSSYYDMYNFLQKIEYDFAKDEYTITMIHPDEVSERLDEIEEILNEMLMKGGI